jgi:hypothetical protein
MDLGENMLELIRHGDVLLVPVKSIPATAVLQEKAPDGRTILAAGEVTGHHHAFAKGVPVDLLVEGATKYIKVTEPSLLRHEEHRALQIPTGIYEIVTPVEYVPKELPRAVAD